jgi:hypothetical protein
MSIESNDQDIVILNKISCKIRMILNDVVVFAQASIKGYNTYFAGYGVASLASCIYDIWPKPQNKKNFVSKIDKSIHAYICRPRDDMR